MSFIEESENRARKAKWRSAEKEIKKRSSEVSLEGLREPGKQDQRGGRQWRSSAATMRD